MRFGTMKFDMKYKDSNGILQKKGNANGQLFKIIINEIIVKIIYTCHKTLLYLYD